MLNEQTSKLLKETVLNKLNLSDVPGQPGINALAKQFTNIAVEIAILTLQEYEKLSQNQES